jgi:hypothetical protein
MGRVISKIIFDANYEAVVPLAETAVNRAFTDEIMKPTLKKDLSVGTESFQKRNKN